MTDRQQNDVLVVLNAPPTLEAHVSDWLMSRPEGGGFTSLPVFGHGSSVEQLTTAEQVAGRERRQQFEVEMLSAAVDGFLADAKQALGNAAIRYWVVPILATGHLGD